MPSPCWTLPTTRAGADREAVRPRAVVDGAGDRARLHARPRRRRTRNGRRRPACRIRRPESSACCCRARSVRPPAELPLSQTKLSLPGDGVKLQSAAAVPGSATPRRRHPVAGSESGRPGRIPIATSPCRSMRTLGLRADPLSTRKGCSPAPLSARSRRRTNSASITGLALVAPAARASSMAARTAARSTWRSSALTGPIEAGRIERLRKPIAARPSASTGRPASSPQKESGVPVAAQRATTCSRKPRKLRLSMS